MLKEHTHLTILNALPAGVKEDGTVIYRDSLPVGSTPWQGPRTLVQCWTLDENCNAVGCEPPNYFEKKRLTNDMVREHIACSFLTRLFEVLR